MSDQSNVDPHYLSDCHDARVYVVGDSFGEGTNHYECSDCHKPCDFHSADQSKSDFDPTQVSLCDNCGCVTHTLNNGKCGKCQAIKSENVSSSEQAATDKPEISGLSAPSVTGEEELDKVLKILWNAISQSVTAAINYENKDTTKISEHNFIEAKNAIIAWRDKSIAQSSAQAELRGRIEELERLPWSHQTHMFSWHGIQDRLAQLRAQGDKKENNNE